MKKIKITAEKVTYRGGSAVKGDVIEVDEKTAGYFLDHGYAVSPPAVEVNKAPIEKKTTGKKAWRKKKVSE